MSCFFLSSVCAFIDFFKGFILPPLRDLCRTHEGHLKTFVLYISCVAVLRAYCGRVAGLQRRPVVLAVVGCDFTLLSGIWVCLLIPGLVFAGWVLCSSVLRRVW